MQTVSFKEQGRNIIMMEGRKIRGFIVPDVNGFLYCIGKPSDASVSMFSKNNGAFTFEEAKQRLLYAYNFGPENVRPCSDNVDYIKIRATEIFDSTCRHWENKTQDATDYQKSVLISSALKVVRDHIGMEDENSRIWIKAAAMFARYLKGDGFTEYATNIENEIHGLLF